jgi:hypothetical protein
MKLSLLSSQVPPDIRFAAAPVLADPAVKQLQLGDNATLRARTALPSPELLPTYLLYADRGSVLIADGMQSKKHLLQKLSLCLRQEVEKPHADLALAVGAMEIVDEVFRDVDLSKGSIYLAGQKSLDSLNSVISWLRPGGANVQTLLRELQSLELICLFPIASKFRNGAYNGDVQFRLNGWGRSLARRSPWPITPAMRTEAKDLLTAHVCAYREVYARHLGSPEVSRQAYADDLFLAACDLPIPVLV